MVQIRQGRCLARRIRISRRVDAPSSVRLIVNRDIRCTVNLLGRGCDEHQHEKRSPAIIILSCCGCAHNLLAALCHTFLSLFPSLTDSRTVVDVFLREMVTGRLPFAGYNMAMYLERVCKVRQESRCNP